MERKRREEKGNGKREKGCYVPEAAFLARPSQHWMSLES